MFKEVKSQQAITFTECPHLLATTVYHHFEHCEAILAGLRGAFSRQAAFDWFSAFVVGQACRQDDLGVSSVVRALCLEPQAYDSLISLFRAESWSAAGLVAAWEREVGAHAPLLEVAGRPVLCSDGARVSKEGARMPGVRRIHQESSTSSKGETIFGHMFGAVGVLAGEPGRCHCLPLEVNLQDGMRAAAGWDGAAELGISDETHPVQSVRCAYRAARAMGRACWLTMDRYFMCAPALSLLGELNDAAEADGLGEGYVRLVTKARSGTVAWEDPPERVPGTRGRPRKRGDKVDVFSLFDTMPFDLVLAEVAGEPVAYDACVVDLLWGQGHYFPLRFVLCVDGSGRREVLVTTDRTLTAAQVITLYRHRWKCEECYRDMKQYVDAFGYHMWSRAMPELDRFYKADDPDRLESVDDPHDRELVLSAHEAISRYVTACCVVTGVLQLLSLAEPEDGSVAWSEYRRTPTRGKVSVRTVRQHMRSRVSSWVAGNPSSRTANFIRQRLVGPGGYRPDAQRRGRR